MRMKAKGQLSFDMAFAVVLLMTVLGMFVAYYNQSEATLTVMNGRKHMALDVLADNTAAQLYAFQNSLPKAPSTATFNLLLPDDYLFEEADGGKYEMNYTVNFDFTGSKIDFEMSGGAMSEPIIETRKLSLSCTNDIDGLEPGDGIRFVCSAGSSCTCKRI